jgi:hypothetical protein
LGSHVLHAPSGAATGTFVATKESDTRTRIDIEVDGGGPLNVWGIYDQGTCAPPPADYEAPFQFADIEGGRRSKEEVWTSNRVGRPTGASTKTTRTSL